MQRTLFRMSKEIHHPQQLTHELSLVSSKVKSLCHLPVTVQQQQQQQDKQLDTNPSGQAFWLNAAKAIDWFQPPKLAYGSSSSESSAVSDTTFDRSATSRDRSSALMLAT